MRKQFNAISGMLAAVSMLVIILDTKTSLLGAQEGLQLCIRTVIPALFPFFVLSGILNSWLLGWSGGIPSAVGKFTKLPRGSESLLLVGLFAGYPVGAQLVSQAYMDKKLKQQTARRMLGFCSNAGPAFMFGMLTPMFRSPIIPWLIWGLHVGGALLVGNLLPGDAQERCIIEKGETASLPQSLRNAIRNMAMVCGWVMVFRIILAFCARWFLWLFPDELQVLFCGMLELSNGCVMLSKLPYEGVRFIMAGFMLSFGGICVAMQTLSVAHGTGLGSYFPGKVMQACITTITSYFLQYIIFPKQERLSINPLAILILLSGAVLAVYLIRRKKVVAFGGRMLYNTGN